MDPAVPVMRPRLPPPSAVRARCEAIDAAGWYSNGGAQVRELESRYAAFLGVDADRVVAVANGTLGIAGAVAISPASWWTVPSFTFPATPSAVLSVGRTPVLADVATDDWWLAADPHDGAVARGEEGLLPVAPFGAAVDLARWAGAAEVVVDAAASLGVRPDLGGLPARWAVVFSLHATKVLGCGEGGLVVLGSAERAAALRAWINFGFDGARESVRVGTNAKMPEVMAAHAHAALDDWDAESADWCAALAVADRLTVAHGLTPQPGIGAEPRPYWTVVLPDADAATGVMRGLAARGVGTRQWWSHGCAGMPAFREVEHRPLPVTEDLAPRVVGLPLFRGLERDGIPDRLDAALAAVRAEVGW